MGGALPFLIQIVRRGSSDIGIDRSSVPWGDGPSSARFPDGYRHTRTLILRAIRTKRPGSIYELATIAGRDLKNVQDDLRLLERYGLVRMSHARSSGKRKVRIPQAVFNGISTSRTPCSHAARTGAAVRSGRASGSRSDTKHGTSPRWG